MPNHVKNIVVLTGDFDTVNQMLHTIAYDGVYGTIDFNKIVPAPADMFRGALSSKDRKEHPLNWYDWQTENWGTKWNAYESDGDVGNLNFKTAWSAPHPVIESLAMQYPSVTFRHSWADEDIGHNCGFRIYENGVCVNEYYGDGGKDAVSFACNIWDLDESDLEAEYD